MKVESTTKQVWVLRNVETGEEYAQAGDRSSLAAAMVGKIIAGKELTTELAAEIVEKGLYEFPE